MNQHQNLDNIYSSIVLPRVCTYSSETLRKHDSVTNEFLTDFANECHKLHKVFIDKRIKTSVEVLLLLLPVPDKIVLIKELDNRLKSMQGI